MSNLRKTLGIDRVQIKRLFSFSDLQDWLDRLTVILEDNYKIQRDIIQGNLGMETSNWKIRETTAADVAAGNAKAVGNLMTEHKVNGKKREVGA